MKRAIHPCNQGMTLLETVVAIGLLAMSLPVSLMALGHCAQLAGQTRFHGTAQWRQSIDVYSLCRADLPPEEGRNEGCRVAIHAEDGSLLRVGGLEDYRNGVALVDGRSAHHLVMMAWQGTSEEQSAGALRRVSISIEEPAAVPAGHRRRVGFRSAMRLP